MTKPYGIIFVLSISTGYSALAYPQSTIPMQFQGEWNVELNDCGTVRNETRLRIYPDQIRFYESVGRVTGVTIINESEIAITATYTGEGSTWESERTFQLLSDGSSLKDISNPRFSMVRRRCQSGDTR
jgi:hypothetical protein